MLDSVYSLAYTDTDLTRHNPASSLALLCYIPMVSHTTIFLLEFLLLLIPCGTLLLPSTILSWAERKNDRFAEKKRKKLELTLCSLFKWISIQYEDKLDWFDVFFSGTISIIYFAVRTDKERERDQDEIHALQHFKWNASLICTASLRVRSSCSQRY